MKKKAIVVDDDNYWRGMLQRKFQDQGFLVKVASNLEKALYLIDREFFHVAIFDLVLDPYDETNTDGITLLEKVKALNEGTAAILLTGYGTMSIAREALLKYNAFDTIEKAKFPVQNKQRNDFIEKIKRAFEHAVDALSKTPTGIDFMRGSTPEYIWSDSILRFLSPTGGIDALTKLLHNLTHDFHPMLYLRKNPEMKFDQESKTINGCYWSKMIGCPILIRLGYYNRIQREANVLATEPRTFLGYHCKKILHSHILKNIGGIICATSPVDFSEFQLNS